MRIGSLEISWAPKKKWPSIWTKSNGTQLTVGEMSNAHVRNTLALIMKKANEGAIWRARKTDELRYTPYIMLELEVIHKYLKTMEEQRIIESPTNKGGPQ